MEWNEERPQFPFQNEAKRKQDSTIPVYRSSSPLPSFFMPPPRTVIYSRSAI